MKKYWIMHVIVQPAFLRFPADISCIIFKDLSPQFFCNVIGITLILRFHLLKKYARGAFLTIAAYRWFHRNPFVMPYGRRCKRRSFLWAERYRLFFWASSSTRSHIAANRHSLLRESDLMVCLNYTYCCLVSSTVPHIRHIVGFSSITREVKPMDDIVPSFVR